MLSLNSATCVPVVTSHTSYMTNHSISSPAHSKSKLVSLPLRLELEIISRLMSSGHSNRNKVGTKALFSPTIIPPTPCPDASFTPTNSGHPATNSLHSVGATVYSRSSVRQSDSACRKKWLQCKYTDVGCDQSTVLYGERRPLPLRMDTKA